MTPRCHSERRPIRRRSSRPAVTRTVPAAAGHRCAPVCASQTAEECELTTRAETDTTSMPDGLLKSLGFKEVKVYYGT